MRFCDLFISYKIGLKSIKSTIPFTKLPLYLQIPLHRITDSASNGSVFPVVTEHFSASSDHAFL